LEVTHRGYLWVEYPVLIDIEFITYIIGLPSRGKTPTQFLHEKTKEKALAEEMKKTYGIERGSRGIIIKRISDAKKRMDTKIMACKLLSKCHKEVFPTGVIATASQCAEGTIVSWNLGTKFHYYWLLILITLVRWREPKYTHLSERSTHFCRT
jgi:hypothetical protein